jgi:hypothetical protein
MGRIFWGLTSVFLLAGCQPAAPDLSEIERRLYVLEASDKVHETLLNEYGPRLDVLESSTPTPPSEYAFFRTTDEGFSIIHTRFGAMLVSMNGVEALGDGSRVTFNVGNISAAEFNGAEIALTYSAATTDGSSPQFQNVSQKFLGDLKPGRWNLVSVNVPGTPPDKLQHLRVGIKIDALSLAR